MTLNEAIEKLLQSEPFKIDARKDAKLRVFLSRYNKGEIKKGAAMELLLKYGYTVDIKKKR